MGHKPVLCAVGIMAAATHLCLAHPGGLDASGGHHDRKRGGYHYHRRTTAPSVSQGSSPAILGIADPGRGDSYRSRSRTTARTRATRKPAAAPANILPLIEEIERKLDGNESVENRETAAEQLDQITTTYSGTPEAAEALRLLKEIRAEEEQERRETASAAEREAERLKRENAAAAKLRLAKIFLESRKFDHARRWLEDLIRTYPETQAASAAQDLLATKFVMKHW